MLFKLKVRMPKFNDVKSLTIAKVKKIDWKSYVVPNGKLILLLPYLVIASIFIITPMIMFIVKAATPVNGLTQADTTAVLHGAGGKVLWDTMGRSIYLGLAAALISLALAFPFAYTVSRSKNKVFKFVSVALLVSPLFIFTIAKVFALKILLIKMYDSPDAIKNQGVMIIGMVYLYMPFMVIPLYSVLVQMPDSLLEASKDLGFNRLSSIIRVVLPYAMKAIFSGIAVVFMLSATSLVISGSLVGLRGKITSNELGSIGNLLDAKAANMQIKPLYAAQGSLIAILTIVIMMAVYGGIYLLPIIYRKLKGGVNA